MPDFKLTKELGTKKFELLMAVDYDEDGNMEFVTDEKDREMCEEMLGTFEDNEGFTNAG